MTEPTKPGEPTGTPTPGQVTPPGQAPANTPVVTPAVPGQAQTPPAGATPPGTPAVTPPVTPAVTPPVVPLDRRPAGTPPPGATGDQTVPLKALQEEREKRQALQSELDQVKQHVQGIQNPGAATYNAPQGAQQAPQAPNNQAREQIERLWETDPREAVRAEITNSLTSYDAVNAQIESQATFLSTKYPDFNNYRTTAMNYIRTLPYDQRAQNGIVELAYMVARGQNVDTILQTREQELMDKFKNGQLAGSLHAPAGASGQPLIPTGDITLTPDQSSAAAAMGMSEVDYIANMSGKGVAV